jgi:5-methylcytosine-specific restriction endonuclease McrA
MNKAKGFASKYGLSLKTANGFIRAGNCGTSGPIAQRLYAAFVAHGRPVPEGRTLREHCIAEAAFVIQTARPFRAPSRAEVARTKVSGVAAASDAFLESYEWRRVRMVALKRYGPRCQCCGATPADGAVMHVDHIKPRRLLPALALEVENLQILCHECNHGKGNWDMTDWREAPEPEPVDPDQVAFLRLVMGEG